MAWNLILNLETIIKNIPVFLIMVEHIVPWIKLKMVDNPN